MVFLISRASCYGLLYLYNILYKCINLLMVTLSSVLLLHSSLYQYVFEPFITLVCSDFQGPYFLNSRRLRVCDDPYQYIAAVGGELFKVA
jgi:hypothetical protein